MDKITFLSTKEIIELNKYGPLEKDLKLIVDNSLDYIKWVLGFNNDIINNPKEIEFRTQLKWTFLRSIPFFKIPFKQQKSLTETENEIINFAIFCNDIFNSDVPSQNVSIISHRNNRSKNLNNAIYFLKSKINTSKWGVNQKLLSIFLEVKTQACIQGLNNYNSKKSLVVQHFGIIEPILTDTKKYETYYKLFRQRKNEIQNLKKMELIKKYSWSKFISDMRKFLKDIILNYNYLKPELESNYKSFEINQNNNNYVKPIENNGSSSSSSSSSNNNNNNNNKLNQCKKENLKKNNDTRKFNENKQTSKVKKEKILSKEDEEIYRQLQRSMMLRKSMKIEEDIESSENDDNSINSINSMDTKLFGSSKNIFKSESKMESDQNDNNHYSSELEESDNENNNNNRTVVEKQINTKKNNNTDNSNKNLSDNDTNNNESNDNSDTTENDNNESDSDSDYSNDNIESNSNNTELNIQNIHQEELSDNMDIDEESSWIKKEKKYNIENNISILKDDNAIHDYLSMNTEITGLNNNSMMDKDKNDTENNDNNENLINDLTSNYILNKPELIDPRYMFQLVESFKQSENDSNDQINKDESKNENNQPIAKKGNNDEDEDISKKWLEYKKKRSIINKKKLIESPLNNKNNKENLNKEKNKLKRVVMNNEYVNSEKDNTLKKGDKQNENLLNPKIINKLEAANLNLNLSSSYLENSSYINEETDDETRSPSDEGSISDYGYKTNSSSTVSPNKNHESILPSKSPLLKTQVPPDKLVIEIDNYNLMNILNKKEKNGSGIEDNKENKNNKKENVADSSNKVINNLSLNDSKIIDNNNENDYKDISNYSNDSTEKKLITQKKDMNLSHDNKLLSQEEYTCNIDNSSNGINEQTKEDNILDNEKSSNDEENNIDDDNNTFKTILDLIKINAINKEKENKEEDKNMEDNNVNQIKDDENENEDEDDNKNLFELLQQDTIINDKNEEKEENLQVSEEDLSSDNEIKGNIKSEKDIISNSQESQKSFDDLFSEQSVKKSKTKRTYKKRGKGKGKGKGKEKEKKEIFDLTNSDDETISISSEDENEALSRGSSTIFIDLEDPENSTDNVPPSENIKSELKSIKYNVISDNDEDNNDSSDLSKTKKTNKRKVVMLPDQTEYIDLSSSSDESRPVRLIDMKSKKRKLYYRKPADSKKLFSVVIPPKEDNVF